jgi:putative ATP-dependent endonuclease of OLD family
MKIGSITVRNFRCLQDVSIPLDQLTVLVGRNGVGKSCVLSALELFYNSDVIVGKEDFYNSDVTQDMSIAIHFSNLTQREKELFDPYLEGDELLVEKIIKYSEPKPVQKYYGMRHKNVDFDSFRKASGSDLKLEYEKLRKKEEYKAFPSYSNKDEAEKKLQEWELANRVKCQRCRDDGQFFGFQNVGTHRLEKYTKFIRIPAVQEASEEGVEKKGSIFEEIMEIVVKSSLATNQDLLKLEEEAQQKYKDLIDPSKNENLKNLEKKLTDALNYFVTDSGVRITWLEDSGVEITPPKAYVKLKEGGYENTIDRCGHGLQRAYVLSLFQQLAVIQASISLRAPG